MFLICQLWKTLLLLMLLISDYLLYIYIVYTLIIHLIDNSTELNILNTKVDTKLIDEEYKDSQISNGLICI